MQLNCFTNIFTSSITGALEVWVRVRVQVHACGVADSVVMATVAVSHWTGIELEVIQRSSGNIRCPLASLWQGSLRGSDKQSTTHIIREDIFITPTCTCTYPVLPLSTSNSLTHSLTHSLIHSFTHSLTHSLTHSFIHPSTHTLTQSLIHLPIHSPNHPLT